MKRTPIRIVSGAAALLVAAGLGAGGGAALYAGVAPEHTTTVIREVSTPAASPIAARTTDSSVNQVYKSARKGVVVIKVGNGQGSGFVYDTQGHIITNDHVVDAGGSPTVTFWNGKTYDARVVGTDPSTDLAVIKVDVPASMLTPLALGDSGSLEVGDGVVAIGSPLGLPETVTSGIVSALHRQMTAPNNFTINDSIQTDAAINHGNSGGPLLDLAGKVVGVNAQIASDSGGNDGIGFAIPSNTVKSIVTQLIGSGSVQHAYLGVGVGEADNGVAVNEIKPGTPAAEANLQVGDVITAIGSEQVTDSASLQKAVDAHKPGDTITLTFKRDGAMKTAQVKLAVRPA
jgi:putative serine protease PepD